MDKILSWKMGKKIKVMEIENILKKYWNFPTAYQYHESCEVLEIPYIFNCAYCSDLAMGGFRFMFYIQNRNDRQEANHLFDSLFSV